MPQTAIDPRTGQRIVVQGGQWVDAQTGAPVGQQQPTQQPQAQPAPQQTQFPGVVQGRPRPVDPVTPVQQQNMGINANQETRAQITFEQEQADRLREEEDRQRTEASRQSTRSGRVQQIDGILGTIDQLESITGDGSGIGSWEGQERWRSGDAMFGVSSWLNQDANDVQGLIEQIQGDLTQQVLAQLVRDNGGSGASGMANTVAEAQRMAAAIAPLSPTMSREEFARGLQLAREYYQRQRATAAQTGGTDQQEQPGQTTTTGDYVGGAGDDENEPFSFSVSYEGHGPDGTPVLPDYLGPVTEEDGTPLGLWYRDNNGERRFIREDARRLSENPALGLNDLGTPLGMMERAVGFGQQITGGGQDGGLASLARHGQSLGLTDEMTGVGTALGGVLTGDFDIAGNYGAGRDAERYRIDQARQNSGWVGTAAELAGGLTFGGGALASGTGRAMSVARGINGPVSRQAIQRGLTVRGAAEGAAIGGTAGFGYGEGAQGSAVNALAGTFAGGALGGAIQARGNALVNRAGSGASEGAQVQQAADRLGMDVLPAMTGGAGTRVMTSGAQQGFISAAPIARRAGQIAEQGGAARDRVAAGVGNVVEGQDAGEIVRRAADVYSRRTSNIGGRLYDRADRMAQGVNAPLTEAVATARRHMAEIAQSPGGQDGSLYRELETLAQQMEGGAFPISGIRALRTRLRDQMQMTGMRGSNTDRVFGEVVEAAQTDMVNALNAAGRQNAAGALQTANNFWRTRVETIDQVLEPVLGRNTQRSGEQITTALERLANPNSGDSTRLRRLMQAMPDDEADSVRATIIHRMGQPRAGSGEVLSDGSFSLPTFLTNWNNMSPRAREIMFPAGSRDALNDLATVAGGATRAGRAMNTSNTAGAAGAQLIISGGIGATLSPAAAIMAGVGQYGAGRLLASRRFARWLSGVPSNPRARRSYFSRLDAIARAEPAIAGQIATLTRAANDNAALIGNVAAESGEERQP